MPNGDSFSDIPWPVFTEDDYQCIDQICEEASTSKVAESDNGAPRVLIELTLSTDNTDILKTTPEHKSSPFELFRKKNYLTVSDIASPAWLVESLLLSRFNSDSHRATVGANYNSIMGFVRVDINLSSEDQRVLCQKRAKKSM